MRQQLGTIVDYVKQCGDNNFWRQSFNDVDSLVLAMICYASLELTPFAKIRNFNCTVRELGELADAKKLTWPLWSRERGEELISAAAFTNGSAATESSLWRCTNASLSSASRW